ncbi:Flap endonuclease 1 [uncultured archaeon]|nr:Flap endonuclease 1 [uncultured archaeon]
MGVAIGDIVPRHTTTLEALSGRIVALDAFNILYQFLASIRQEDGTPLMDFKSRPTGHLSGLFYRNARLIENGIRPVYVFDGAPPSFKQKEIERRQEAKKEAEAKWRDALDYGRMEDARKFAQATSRLTPEMVAEAKDLLSAMGIPWLDAPSEGEAQAAHMAKKGVAYASASQDYDSILFASPRLLRNLSITGKRKVPRQDRYVLVEPEEIVFEEVLSALQLNQEQIILIGLLCGTDFNKGVKGVGPKTALKIVKDHATLGKVKEYVKTKYNYEFEEDMDAIFDFFLNPPVKEVPQVKFSAPNAAGVNRILVEEHDFSDERVGRVLGSMEKAVKEKGAQKKMDLWF